MKLVLPLNLASILLQISLTSEEFTLILAAVIVVVIVILIVVVLLLLRRRTHPASDMNAAHHHIPMFVHPTEISTEGSPTSTVLEVLKKDLEDASSAFTAGLLDRKEFYERMSEIKTTFDDLRKIREVVPSPPPAKASKACNSCAAEIPVESKFCDRCGTKQEA